MSRCYPFPPPGYVRKEASRDALIESIKLQREREKAKTERKKEKKEKREKRKEKKRKEEKAALAANDKSKCLSNSSTAQGDKNLANSFCQNLQKHGEDDSEHLEKSGLSEEHEPPVFWQNSSYSSDSIENRNKRKRQTAYTDGHSHGGNVIKIRLPVQKNEESPESYQKEVTECKVFERNSSDKDSLARHQSAKTGSLPRHQNNIGQAPIQGWLCTYEPKSTVASDAIARLDTELPSTSGRVEVPTETNSRCKNMEIPAEADFTCKKPRKKMRRAEQKYKALTEDWVPPSLQVEQIDDGDDDGWLFDPKYHDQCAFKSCKSSVEIMCDLCPAMLPHAHYISEPEICVLPYTVPF